MMKRIFLVFLLLITYLKVEAQNREFSVFFAKGYWHSTMYVKGVKSEPMYSLGIQFRKDKKIFGISADVLSSYKLPELHKREWANGDVKTFEYFEGKSLNFFYGFRVWQKKNWNLFSCLKGGFSYYNFFNQGEGATPNSGRLDFLLGMGGRLQYDFGKYCFLGIQADLNLSPNMEILNGKLEPFNQITYFTTKMVLGLKLF